MLDLEFLEEGGNEAWFLEPWLEAEELLKNKDLPIDYRSNLLAKKVPWSILIAHYI